MKRVFECHFDILEYLSQLFDQRFPNQYFAYLSYLDGEHTIMSHDPKQLIKKGETPITSLGD